MANNVTGFFQTLVAASTKANEALVGTTALLDAVYLDYSPITAAPYQTLNVPIPQQVTGQVADAGTGDPVFTDVAAVTKPISLNKHPQYGFRISDFEQYTSAEQIRQVFIDPAIKGIAETANAAIAALLNSGALPVNPVIATTGSIVPVANFLTGFARLADQKVPVQDMPNMSYISAPTVYAKTLQDPQWTQESIASARTAEEARRMGNLRAAFGSTPQMDQQMPTVGATPGRTFTGVYMHRFAIALISRPLPPAPADGVTLFCTYTRWRGFSIRITMQYLVTKGGWVVSVDAGFGIAVMRPEMAQLFSVAE